MSFRTIIRFLSLGFFIFLLWMTTFPLKGWFPVDFFLRLDPLIFLGTVISSRQLITALIPGLLILLLTLVLGRFFCGYICPMGITLDVTDKVFGPGKNNNTKLSAQKHAVMRNIKYLVLLFILGTCLLGISSVFLASPLSLVTRFYGLVLYPGLVFMGEGFLTLVMPLSSALGVSFLTYAELEPYRFATQWFILLFFAAVFALAYYSPRFWCRYLCPSGALMALFSRNPVVGRKVSEACTDCSICQKKCPMDAIDSDPTRTSHHECIACETCVRVCPEQAVNFGIGEKKSGRVTGYLPARRQVLASLAAGAGSALLIQTGISSVKSEFIPGNILPSSLIRPPGALPEESFLGRCIRCGQCMKVCPTNTLQPVWLDGGLGGIFSPKVLPRRGPCDPLCNACGMVCPSGALRSLPLAEKMWAKIGTSYIIPFKCLAWEWKRECLVCYEVCPYAALELKRVDGNPVPVPYVIHHKCSGCGACEYHCPVQAGSAIVVEPMESLRMSKGSYIDKGRAIGLDLEADPDRQRRPPGHLFDGDDPGDLPPGFSS
ncbi:4Fe-4S binding protein [Desulfonatronovibrio hydrogenovorans]|uniref:4Fe-4S binding protein n=1 Tax=Desulfonatronovibrio hydrogenovorans TaxID=53245 RepID=UPI0005552040|nr:4Fe-4S binding protein [Desulfonatronovibrio hydrogenovorans]